MKQFFTLLSLLLVMGMSANVMAQTDSGTTPFVGSEHKYSVTDNGNSYVWSVTTDIAGNTSAGALVSLSGETTSEVTITWDNPTVGETYYVHVVETGANCSNHKAIAVVPQNAFELLFVNVATDGTDQDVDAAYAVCPPAVEVTSYDGSNTGALADATNFTYDYGTTYLYYHITASGLNTANTDWTVTVSPTIAAAIDGTVNADWGTYDGSTWTQLETDGAISSSDFAYTVSGTDNVYLRLAVAHSTTYEGTDDADITLEVTGADENSNPVTDVNSKSATSDSELQTISGRPATTTISTSGL